MLPDVHAMVLPGGIEETAKEAGNTAPSPRRKTAAGTEIRRPSLVETTAEAVGAVGKLWKKAHGAGHVEKPALFGAVQDLQDAVDGNPPRSISGSKSVKMEAVVNFAQPSAKPNTLGFDPKQAWSSLPQSGDTSWRAKDSAQMSRVQVARMQEHLTSASDGLEKALAAVGLLKRNKQRHGSFRALHPHSHHHHSHHHHHHHHTHHSHHSHHHHQSHHHHGGHHHHHRHGHHGGHHSHHHHSNHHHDDFDSDEDSEAESACPVELARGIFTREREALQLESDVARLRTEALELNQLLVNLRQQQRATHVSEMRGALGSPVMTASSAPVAGTQEGPVPPNVAAAPPMAEQRAPDGQTSASISQQAAEGGHGEVASNMSEADELTATLQLIACLKDVALSCRREVLPVHQADMTPEQQVVASFLQEVQSCGSAH